jgi:AcrR family transcriptional regulator
MPIAPEDQTAQRLLEAAGQVFAEQGFQSATVRDICARAGANVAAVNYHFRDKMGLYVAVLRKSVGAESPQSFLQLATTSKDPEAALRAIIHQTLHRILGMSDSNAWHSRIMAHELAQPSAALDRVVEEVIGPNYAVLRKVISRILGTPPGHDRTRLCAHSVIGQVIHYSQGRQVISRLWPKLEFTKDRINQIADHITEFSLNSLRMLAKKKGTTV